MFNNIGRKIKGLADFLCWVGIIVNVIIGMVLLYSLIGIIFLILGPNYTRLFCFT